MSRRVRAAQTYAATHGGATQASEGLRRAALRRLYEYARPHRGTLVLAIVCIACAALIQMALMYLSKEILGVEPGGEVDEARVLLQMRSSVLLLLVVGALLAVFTFGQVLLWNTVALKTVRDLRRRMFSHLHLLALGFYDRARSGEVMSRLVNDTYVLQTALGVDVPGLIAAPVAVSAGVALMLTLSWRVTIIALVVVPVIVLTVWQLGRRLRRIVAAMQAKVGDLQSVLQESISGIRVVKCFGMEETEAERFREENQELYRHGLRAARVSAVFRPLGDLIGLVGFVAVIAAGMVEIGAGRLVLAELVALALLIQRVGASLNRAGRGTAMLQQASAICERSFELLDTQPEIIDKPGAPDLDPGDGAVAFRNVSFGYSDDELVLDDISFEIPPGCRVAVVGPSGAGKSTIANVLPRLYERTSGQILINGQDISAVRGASLRRHIGVVLQEPFLFSGTVGDNIRVGKPDASDEDVREAARSANADGFIEALPKAYDTSVGERGLTLSGGERQRIAIARALLRDPKVLILDEATSSLDSESEAAVQVGLEALMRDRTTLVIAHRLSTIAGADEILVIDDGRIIERGTHEALIAAGGQYAALWRLQAGDRTL